MLIYVGEPHYKLITAELGTGDNLDEQDIADGYVDYLVSSVYEKDGDEIKLVDGGQILSSKPFLEMDDDEILKRIFDYWEVGDPEDREADYVILDR